MMNVKANAFGTIPLADLLDAVDRGELALPELQRPAVWQDAKVPELLDSVYCDYPFGAMLLWTPPESEPIRARQWKFAPADGPSNTVAPTQYLIDGQQRLTAFYRALRGSANADHGIALPIAFHVRGEEFALVDGEIKSKLSNSDRHGWFLLRELLAMPPEALARVARAHAESAQVSSIVEGVNRLQPNRIGVAIYAIAGRTYAEVVDIFDRVNRGTPVRESQKVLAYLSSICPGVVGLVEGYLEEMVDTHGRNFDLDLFVTALALAARGYAEMGPLRNHYEEYGSAAERRQAVTDDVGRVRTAVGRALDLLDRRLGMDTLQRVPNVRSLLCLSFAMLRGLVPSGDEQAEREAGHWMSRSLLTGYHGDAQRFKADVAALRDAEGRLPFERLKTNLRGFGIVREVEAVLDQVSDEEYVVSRNGPVFQFMYAMLKMGRARSFPSGQPMWSAVGGSGWHADSVGPPLDVHHINPIAQLERVYDAGGADASWLTRAWFHDVANFTHLTRNDNSVIGDSPIGYLRDVNPSLRVQHLIGTRDYRPGDYGDFIRDRRRLIRAALEAYLAGLRVD